MVIFPIHAWETFALNNILKKVIYIYHKGKHTCVHVYEFEDICIWPACLQLRVRTRARAPIGRAAARGLLGLGSARLQDHGQFNRAVLYIGTPAVDVRMDGHP